MVSLHPVQINGSHHPHQWASCYFDRGSLSSQAACLASERESFLYTINDLHPHNSATFHCLSPFSIHTYLSDPISQNKLQNTAEMASGYDRALSGESKTASYNCL